MEGKMPATGYEERGGSSSDRREGRPPAASEESFLDVQQQYAQYQQQQQQQQHGYYQPVAPYPSDYPGYGPGYPAHGGYHYPYPGPSQPPPSHEFHYAAHFAYPPLAPMPPNPPPGVVPHYPRPSQFPQISPDSVPPRGKRRLEGAAAAGRDNHPPSSSKKARRGAQDRPTSKRSSALPPSSIAFRTSPASSSASPPHHDDALALESASLYRGSPTGSLSGMGTPSSLGQSRYDSSLGLLAKRFVHRLKGAPGSKMDLNQLVQELGVQKRRIYDITNVLEGIGLIVKEGKKLVAWVQDPKVDLSHAPEEPTTQPSESGSRTEEALKKDVEEMRKEDASLAKFIEILKSKSQTLSTSDIKSSLRATKEKEDDAAPADSRRFMFVRYTDITSLPMYGNDSIVGVKAPPGTKVEIPDFEPGATLQHRMYLNSSGTTKSRKAKDPIRVYLIRPEALPGSGSAGGAAAAAESKESPVAASRSHAQGGTPPSAGQRKRRPREMLSPMLAPPTAVAATSYPTPSWGPPGHPPPPMHHHDPHQRPVGVTPEELRLGGTPKSSRTDRYRRQEFVRSTPQRPSPPRTSPPSTPFALGDGRWDAAPPTPVASGAAAAAGFFSPAWSRTGSYFGPPWEEGAMDTPNPFAPPGSYGIGRTHSPMTSQQELYNMPLQSPAGSNQRGGGGYAPTGSFLSPTVSHGFSPTLPGIHYRTTDAQFPLPTLHAEGRTAPSRSHGPEEPSRSTISELPDPSETNEPALPGPATRVKPRRRR